MTLFNKIVESNSLPALSADEAMSIYELLKTKDANVLFLEEDIATEYTEQVEKELKRLESEVVSKMSGSFVTTPKVPATYDEMGEVDKEAIPAVYYKVTTETALKSSLSSDLLDVDTVVADVRAWSDGNPDETPNWTTYKNSFSEE